MKLKLLIRGQQTLSFNFLEQLTFTSGIKTFTETISAKYEITNLTHNSMRENVCLHFETPAREGKRNQGSETYEDMKGHCVSLGCLSNIQIQQCNIKKNISTFYIPLVCNWQFFVMSQKNRKHCANNILYDALLDSAHYLNSAIKKKYGFKFRLIVSISTNFCFWRGIIFQSMALCSKAGNAVELQVIIFMASDFLSHKHDKMLESLCM